METIFWIMGIVIYIVGIIICVIPENRRLEPKDMRKGLIWPILFVWDILKIFILGLNELFYGFFLIFGFRYNTTKLYGCIYYFCFE